ncbi:MAG: SDR family NAD(P)-dependent oxidoreductase [Candidatus Thermoplasmatota archaeon]|nr:SDR family NAD(P)-dependent oxidoreductase [Candidatus Thermoplasmatota archaeon]
MELKGSVALVTGGGRGIGLAIVRALASAGVRVVLDDAGLSIDGHPQEPELASRVEKELRGEGLEVRGSSLDVSTWENAKTLHTFATETYGPPDILVNNAAILQDPERKCRWTYHSEMMFPTTTEKMATPITAEMIMCN